MGKDYSESAYKKTYQSEYSKSYDKRSVKEREHYDGIPEMQTGSVDPSGPQRRVQRKAQRTELPATQPIPKVQSKPIVQQSPPKMEAKPTTTPPRPKPEAKVQKTTTYPAAAPPAPPKTGSPTYTQSKPQYTPPPNLGAFQHPIRLVSPGKYQIIKTGEVVDGEDAREILYDAAYNPAGISIASLGVIVIAFVTFMFSTIVPIVLFFVGAFIRSKTETTYEKKVNGEVIKFQLPANDEEIARFKTYGTVYSVIGAVLFLIKMYMNN